MAPRGADWLPWMKEGGSPRWQVAESELGFVTRRVYVIQRKRRIVPSVAGESGDGMASLLHHCPSKY
eukprot:603025-Pleurochrysis_carterae.AAC.1